MRILINGLPHFSRTLAKDLNEFDRENHYVFCDTYYSVWGKICFLLNLPFSKVVISSNGVSDESASLKLALNVKKKMIMLWHGTDVELANERMKNGSINWSFIRASKHLIAAPWFAKELNEIVGNPVYAPISYSNDFGNDQRYEQQSILTYFATGSEALYGWEFIRAYAIAHPGATITVVGTDGAGLEASENVVFKGWVNQAELFTLLREHPVFLRLTEHDGKSLMVTQALSVGCEVLWTNPMEPCVLVERNLEDLSSKLKQVFEKVSARSYMPNEDNIAFAKKHLTRNEVMNHFLKQLKSAIND